MCATETEAEDAESIIKWTREIRNQTEDTPIVLTLTTDNGNDLSQPRYDRAKQRLKDLAKYVSKNELYATDAICAIESRFEMFISLALRHKVTRNRTLADQSGNF